MNVYLKQIFEENNLNIIEVSRYTTLDIIIIEKLLNAEYPMSSGIAQLFHGLLNKTEDEWKDACNQYFRELKSQPTKISKDFVIEKARSREQISRKKYGDAVYTAIIRYRKAEGIFISCVNVAKCETYDTVNGMCDNCCREKYGLLSMRQSEE